MIFVYHKGMKNINYLTDNQIYDVIIVGAGASGLFAAASADFHAKGNASDYAKECKNCQKNSFIYYCFFEYLYLHIK